MNDERRKKIQLAIDKITEARTMLEEAHNEEQDYFDGMPDGLRDGDKGTKAEAAVNSLDEAVSTLDEMGSTLTDIL